MKRRHLAGLLATAFCGSIHAQGAAGISDDAVRIGLLLDMSSLYADITGPGSVAAAQMAIDDFGGKVRGKPVQLVYADHQNKADIAATKAREWFDRDKVDAILDVAASGPALIRPASSTRRCGRRRAELQVELRRSRASATGTARRNGIRPAGRSGSVAGRRWL